MKFLNMKKGEITWDYLGKILIILAIFAFVVLLIWVLRDKSFDLFSNFKDTILGLGG